MKIEKYLQKECKSLEGKVVAVTGSTGGLGQYVCQYVASLGGSLLLLDRNEKKSAQNKERLERGFGAKVECHKVDMSDIFSVKALCENLKGRKIDYLVLNAGAYSLPREKSAMGYDNVFQINFISPYVLTKGLLDGIKNASGKVVVVGSIAHKYSRINEKDVDFSLVKAPRKVYGNAKRFLMFSLEKLLEKEGVSYAIAHPGITPTNITSHYPKWISAVIKYPMKAIFTSPKKAGLNIMKGLFAHCPKDTWIGPRVCGIWGKPKLTKLKTCTEEEKQKIFEIGEIIYKKAEKIMRHTLGVQAKYYDLIRSGEKIFEGRLNDEKRRQIAIGDIITIKKDPERVESFDVRVVDKICFANFYDMAKSLGCDGLGFKGLSAEQVAEIYREFYSNDKQKEFGVVAIKVEKL